MWRSVDRFCNKLVMYSKLRSFHVVCTRGKRNGCNE
ncbi:unnamed protein product [Tenebrio molitor]|nr:unnamed protein product [Tenebrio molitor]